MKVEASNPLLTRIGEKLCLIAREAFSPKRESVIFSIYMPTRYYETKESSPKSNIQRRVLSVQFVNEGNLTPSLRTTTTIEECAFYVRYHTVNTL